VIPKPGELRSLGFTPLELYEFSHRFDDIHHRFRTLYCAELPETCLREVLADFRPNLGAQSRHVERYGPEAAEDFAPEPVTARWREQHVLVPVVLRLDGALIDLTEVPTRQEIENRHVELLLEHDLDHLDLHEITTRRRVITQTIAAELFDRAAGAVRFPSRQDGSVCVALFEGRAPLPRRENPSRLPIRLPNRSPASLEHGVLCWSLHKRSSRTPNIGRRMAQEDGCCGFRYSHSAHIRPRAASRAQNAVAHSIFDRVRRLDVATHRAITTGSQRPKTLCVSTISRRFVHTLFPLAPPWHS
jgi:hypothetical protein